MSIACATSAPLLMPTADLRPGPRRSASPAPADSFTGVVRAAQVSVAPWCKPCAEALVLAGAGALTASRTVTPYLLSLQAPVENGLLYFIPGVGPALQAMMGTGVLGCAASACVLSAAVGGLTAPREGPEAKRSWLLAHLSLGFALSPLVGIAGGLATVPLVLLLGCVAGLSCILTARLVSGRCGWAGAIAGITLALAAAPAAAQLAMGTAGAAVSGNILRTLTTGSILATAYHLYGAWPRFVSNQTAYLERFLARPEDVRRARLDLPGATSPTVFGTSHEIVELVSFCKLARAHREPIGMMKALLLGPAGSGKTEMSRGIASELGAYLAIVDAPSLSAYGSSRSVAANVLEIFSQAREASRLSGRVVVLLFDEAETLFCNREHLPGATAESRERGQIVNVFLQCLDGAQKPADDNLVVIAATNYPDRLDAAIRQRFLLGAQLQPPGRHQLKAIFNAHLRNVLEQSPLRHLYGGTPIDPSLGEDVAAIAAHERWVGRDITSLVSRIATKLAAAPRGARQPNVRVAVEEALAAVSQNLQRP